MISVIAVVVTCFAIAVVGHGGSDEHDGRTEQVLATATSRSRAFLATAIVALAGATWLLLVAGVTLALGVGNNTDHAFGMLVPRRSPRPRPCGWWSRSPSSASRCAASGRCSAGGSWSCSPPSARSASCSVCPQWVLDLSPYSHAPRMPLADFEPVPALVLTLTAAVLLVGFVAALPQSRHRLRSDSEIRSGAVSIWRSAVRPVGERVRRATPQQGEIVKYMLIMRATDEAYAAFAERRLQRDPRDDGQVQRRDDPAGVLVAAEGLDDAEEGVVVDYSSKPPVVTDGPYGETKELFGGYWILDVASKEEAVEWAKRAPLAGRASRPRSAG